MEVDVPWTAQPWVPEHAGISQLRDASRACRHCDRIVATVHPSSLLRAPDEETRHRETARFVDDLRVVARFLHSGK